MGQVSSSMVKRSQNDFLNISLAGFQKHLKNGCAFFFQRGYVQVQKKLTLHSEKSTCNLKITPSGEENHLQNLHFWFQNPNFRGCNTLFEVPFQIKSLDLQILEALEKTKRCSTKSGKGTENGTSNRRWKFCCCFFGNDAFIPCSISKQKVSVSASIARG